MAHTSPDHNIDFTAPLDTKQLIGRRVLITGGASGIGAGCARLFVTHGAHVVIADLNEELGKAVVTELEGIHFIPVDVTSFTSQKAMFATALEILPGHEIDVLIPCAVLMGGFWDYTPQPASSLTSTDPSTSTVEPPTKGLQVGLLGTYHSALLCSKYCMGLHQQHSNTPSNPLSSTPSQSGSGPGQLQYDKAIILIGSLASYGSLPGSPEYTSMKWGTRGLFRSLRIELLKTGVRVHMLAPTFVETPMTASIVPQLKKAGASFASVESVAEVVGRLVGERGVNGEFAVFYLFSFFPPILYPL
ncbi:NAD(P)-binding protein [Cadophora sp. DSE1049]|nr:NAD(P)-binding protein [Cadophora sp. DSE1049]